MISIIGAGPVGCYLGAMLAKKGYDVQIFEEHISVGKPVQCTGLLTSEIAGLVKLRKGSVANTVNTVKIVSPDKNSVYLRLNKKEVAVDRQLFDQQLADDAVGAGAKLHLNHRFVGLSGKSITVKDKDSGKSKSIRPDFIIGADGVRSAVAKQAGLDRDRQFLTGMQARLRLECDPGTYEVYFGSSFPGFFGWVVPESKDVVRIGLASKENPEAYFNKFLNARAGDGWKRGVIGLQGGLMPLYRPGMRTSSGNIFLVGDAACQIKNTTAGGIVPGLLAAEALAGSIAGSREYENEWRAKIGRDLWLHYRLRKALDSFSDKDYNRLVAMCSRPSVQKAIETQSREFPAKLLLKLILSEPRLLRFGLHIF